MDIVRVPGYDESLEMEWFSQCGTVTATEFSSAVVKSHQVSVTVDI